MKNRVQKTILVVSVFAGFFLLGSWTGGPSSISKNDSLAIIRVVKPMHILFGVKPAVYVSKGLGKIDQVSMNDIEDDNGSLAAENVLINFLANGYSIQTSTETVDNGLKLNTYYLKKKVI